VRSSAATPFNDVGAGYSSDRRASPGEVTSLGGRQCLGERTLDRRLLLANARLVFLDPARRADHQPNFRVESSTMSASGVVQLDPSPDPVIERYKQDIDRTLIRENLRKSHEERLLTLQRMQAFVAEVRAAGEATRRGK